MWFVLTLVAGFIAYCWYDSARASFSGSCCASSENDDRYDSSSNRAVYDQCVLPYDYDPFETRNN
jgi:hypothetical protein